MIKNLIVGPEHEGFEIYPAESRLVDTANQNGGRDNISVVLVRVPKAFLPSAAWAQRYLAKKRAG